MRELESCPTRIEHDTLGEVEVPQERLWGAQTQRSKQNFPIGSGCEVMPEQIIHAFGYLKWSCALANHALRPEVMSEDKLQAIESACKEIVEGKLDDEFPLVIFQTGSGTQTNMNTNEVIANFTNLKAQKPLLHPNDDVNMGQSSNDTFPSAMHIASVIALESDLLPAVDRMIERLEVLEEKYGDVVKSGRTHLQDAVPITFGQEISGWRSSLEQDRSMLKMALDPLRQLAIGGTAVGTGLNAPHGFDVEVCNNLTDLTGSQFIPASNKFHALTSLDEMVFASGAIKALAMDMMKMANDIRWLASGPRAGLGEITIPANEPGSSIMPGKVNPTQCEQVTMVAAQILGCDSTIGFAASQGNFELNVFLPVTAYNFLQEVRLLSQSIASFGKRCVEGIVPNREVMHRNLHNSLMLSTLLAPYIGYEKAASLAHWAQEHNSSLKEANEALKYMSEEEFERVFKPEEMV